MTSKMTKPLFSIVTITKDNKLGLIKTQQSIQSQSCTNYEWIIIDGASQDGTQDILRTINSPDHRTKICNS